MKFKIGFFAIMLFLSLLLDPSLFSLAALLAATTHEFGHLLMAIHCNIQFKECKIGIYGAGLMPDSGLYSYKKEILLCLAGPLTNFFCGTFSILLLQRFHNEFLLGFTVASFSLGILNLLPICDFDGGRILKSMLCLRFSPEVASLTVQVLSFCFIFLLWLLSVYLLLRALTSLSLFVFSISLFGKIFITTDF